MRELRPRPSRPRRRPEPSGAAGGVCGGAATGAAAGGRQRRLRCGGLGADRRARGHLTQAGARAVLGAEQAAVLLGEGVGDRAGGDEAEIDEHLPERRAAAILLGEGVQKLVFRQEALVDHDLAQLSPGVSGAASTSDLYRPKRGKRLKGSTHARPPARTAPRRASGRRSRRSARRSRDRTRAAEPGDGANAPPTSATIQPMNRKPGRPVRRRARCRSTRRPDSPPGARRHTPALPSP